MIFDSFVKGKHKNVFPEKMAFLKFLLFTLKLHMEKWFGPPYPSQGCIKLVTVVSRIPDKLLTVRQIT